MDYKYIEQLLDRYWDGQTSLEEEAILRAFFSQDAVPANLAAYKAFFSYANDKEGNVLGDDFDERMEALVGQPEKVKAKVVPFRQRLAPLFKAAAVVAIILTLGNASQMAFNDDQESLPQTAGMQQKSQNGPSVAMGDSVKMDTLQKAAAATPVILK